jgi:hypothetical protein
MTKSLLKFVLLMFGMILCLKPIWGGELVTVYYVPFQIETYVPITESTIISKAWEKWALDSDEKISELNTILHSGEQSKFEGARVRMLVVSANHKVYIDSNGVASEDGQVGIRIDKNAFLKFRESLSAEEKFPSQGTEQTKIMDDKKN